MNDDLTRRLLLAESDFLTALQNGSQMLSSFRETLSTLPNALSTAMNTGGAGNDTLSLAHSVASRILNIASCYLHVRDEEETFSTQLRIDCDAMVHRMDALDLNAQPGSLCSDSSLQTCFPISPPFIAPAYQWLLANLHNPYPTTKVKGQIAAASSCLITSVNSWFLNARRRIGWTTLCRDHFSNCRADMLDAAHRAFVEEDPQRVLSPEIRHSFIAMKVAAEGLYSSVFSQSTSVDLDAAAEQTVGAQKESVAAEECSVIRLANSGKLQMVQCSYPPPDWSLATSSVPALHSSSTDDSEEEDVVPQIAAGSKRRRSYIEPGDQQVPATSRPIKRLRSSMTSHTPLPFPPTSTNGNELPSDAASPRLSELLAYSKTDVVLPSRRPHISDIHDSGNPKISGGLAAATRLHTVLDPHIANASIDDWFTTNFDTLFAMPPPVDTIEPDLSMPREVELFKDYCIPEDPKAPNWLPYPSAMTHLFECDGLLQSIASDTHIAPRGNTPPSSTSGTTHAPSLDSSVPDVSQIDWISIFNGSDVYQSTIGPTFSQHPLVSRPLPDIDLSVLQLPLIPTTQTYGDLASKREKLGQLHAMQEAVRQMAQELQSEGVVVF